MTVPNMAAPNTIVSPQWLQENLRSEEVIILDASMEKSVSDSPPATLGAFIPGSIRFDFEKTIRDGGSELPHMLPTPSEFEKEVRRLGVCRHHCIVVYGNRGTYASPRAWWMFKAMGHENVVVLDGGIPEWLALGLPTEDRLSTAKTEGDFSSDYQPRRVCDLAGINRAVDDLAVLIVDARSAGRFAGTEPEPRPGLRSGNIPTSCSIPFGGVLDGHRLADPSKLAQVFGDRAASEVTRLIATCGSGVTACVLALAAESAGYQDVAVYDGSWAEFGRP